MSFQLLLNNLEGHGTYYIILICIILKLQREHYRYRETSRGEGNGKWEEAKIASSISRLLQWAEVQW